MVRKIESITGTIHLFIIFAIFVILSTCTIAKEPPHKVSWLLSGGFQTQEYEDTSQYYINIDNGIINIDRFGDSASGLDVWDYNGGTNTYFEEPLISYGGNSPVYLSHGTLVQSYAIYGPTGSPDIWYDSIHDVDLDGDSCADVRVTRSVMVPSGKKYFLIRYTVKNIKGSVLSGVRLFQGVDYDAGDGGSWDEGGYSNGIREYVWTHDLDDGWGTYVGFTSTTHTSVSHDVDYYNDTWAHLEAGSLNNELYLTGDVSVAMEWHIGALENNESETVEVKHGFGDSSDELHDILVPEIPAPESAFMVGLIALLSPLVVYVVKKKE